MLEEDNHYAYDARQKREKYCFEWLKNKKKAVAQLITMTALIGVFKGVLIIAQSALLAYIFHQIVMEKQVWTDLANSFLFLLLVFSLRALSAYYYQVLGFKIAITIKRSLREQLIDKFSQLGPAYIKQKQNGELAATTLECVEALEGYFSRYLPQQMIVTFLPLIMIAVVMPINWVVAVIFLISGPLIPLFMALVGMGAASANRNQFLAMARMSGYFLDRIKGLTTLKLFGRATAELDTIKKVAMEFREKTMSVLAIAFLSSAVLEFFSAVAVALVAVYVGLGLLGLIHFGPADNISLQAALFVLLLAPEFFNPLKQLATFYHDKAAAIGAVDQILKVLDQPLASEIPKQQSHSEFCIDLQNVSLSYQNKQVLKPCNIQIKVGEKIALTGASGAGKTTLFNLLLGIEAPTEGTVLVMGQCASQGLSAKNIAWAGQQASIFHATIKENISLFHTDISDQQIEEAAKAAAVTAYSKNLDQGLLTQVGEHGYGLSGGQIQRLALARTFAKKAEIVLLDEPTAHLDSDTKIRLLDTIEQLFKDKTLIIASHDAEVIARMQRVVHLT